MNLILTCFIFYISMDTIEMFNQSTPFINQTNSPIHYLYNHGTKELKSETIEDDQHVTENGENYTENVTQLSSTSSSSYNNDNKNNRILELMRVLVEKTILTNETASLSTRSTNHSRLIDGKLWLPLHNQANLTAKPMDMNNGICDWKIITKPISHIQKIKIKKISKVANVTTISENRREVVCCEGYLPDMNLTKCIPQCPGGCIGGICLAPGRCRCPNDTVLSNGGACIRICPHSCLNGLCIGDLCLCKPGYMIDPSGQFCIPYCGGPNSCKMGNCSAPGVCDCPPGYHFDRGDCIPICPGGCLNGQCVAPNDCHCLPGYHPYLVNACRRHCTPAICGRHGHCADLFHCRCHPGWRLDPETSSCNLQDHDDDLINLKTSEKNYL